MSGNSRQGGQGGQGGQQPPQGGQQGGGQQQRGQQPRSQTGRQPQGGGPPQQTGGGDAGRVDTGSLRSILLWSLAAFAIAGLVFGLLPLLFGFAGDYGGQFADGGHVESVPADSDDAQNQSERTALANDIVRDELSDDNVSAADAYAQMQSQNRVAQLVISISPFLGVLFALVTVLLVTLRSSTDEVTLAAGVAVATVVGLVLFVVLSTAVAGFQHNAMSEDDWKNEYNTNPNDWGFNDYPPGDIDQEAQQRWQDEHQNQFDRPPTQGLSEASTVPTISTIDDLKINYGTLVVNTLLMAVVTALGAVGIAGVSTRLSDELA